MGILSDVQSVLGVGDAFTVWKAINQANIDKAYNQSQNTINELNASATLQRLNNEAVQISQANRDSGFNPFAGGGGTDSKKMLGYALIGVAALASVYLLTKK